MECETEDDEDNAAPTHFDEERRANVMRLIQDLLEDESTHDNIRNAFENMKKNHSLLTPEKSAKRLVEILNKPKGAFKSGDHVDYFDEV